MTEELKKVIVLGAGVVGLTTALKIQERGGYQVTIIADVLPSDAKTIMYTSHWAGAHHVFNVTNDKRHHRMELDTFTVMWELSKPGSPAEECFLRKTQTEYFYDLKHLPQFEGMPDYRVLPKDALPSGIVHGSMFTTISIDTPNYLLYLTSRFTESGGRLIKGSVQHINQVLEGGEYIFSAGKETPTPPHAIVVCTGIRTRFLGGVEDQMMYPIRGQTVLIRAPWIKFGRTMISQDEVITYIIPRKSGDVILGGTREADDWFPLPRPETRRDILERTLAICPELAPPEIREQREPTIEDIILLIIEDGCGFRPARKGGVRLEVEWHEARRGGQKIPVIFNYGHDGYGFQASWGSADISLKLLEESLGGTASD